MKPKIKPQAVKPLLLVSDDCPDANGFTTIRRADGTKNGNTDAEPIATVCAEADAALIVRAVNAHAEDSARIEKMETAYGQLIEAAQRAHSGAVAQIADFDDSHEDRPRDGDADLRDYLVSVRDEAAAALRAAGEEV